MSFNSLASHRTATIGGPGHPPYSLATGAGSAMDSTSLGYDPRKVYPENGRFYQAWPRGKYLFPCDDVEGDRLDIFHKVFILARNGQYLSAPLDHPGEKRILDLGCGTGIWAIDVAEQDAAQPVFVRGVDLALIQPDMIPRNVEFVQMDIELPWQSMGRDSWDVIHMRTLIGSIYNWRMLYDQVIDHLRPGVGRLEQVEIDFTPRCDDGSLPPTAEMVSWANDLFDAFDAHGCSLRIDSLRTRNLLGEAGFVDFEEEIFKVPVNGWHPDPTQRELGRFLCLGLTRGLYGMSLAPLRE